MQQEWFPQINSDIFISHSHRDEKLAITFAGWLNAKFGLKCFIDSCIWGYGNKLLEIIDRKYCPNEKGGYDYDKRNVSTSHVHMMLSSALAMMIDKTECLFFLNTNNSSISLDDIGRVENKTLSPWIYYEIGIARMIRIRVPQSHRKVFSKSLLLEGDEYLKIAYPLNINHLSELTLDNLIKWVENYSLKNREHPLDILYKLKSPS
ncbi:MAG: hypothetical protein SFU98_00055 [Leptospiraceae bacterium]|nr:hypothetical protein [Leptospiraceae bacterium]